MDRALLLATMGVTAVLGGLRLGTPSFWLDEAWSVVIVDPAAGGGGVELLTEPDLSGMLYYLLLRAWFPLAGMEEWLLRLPSLVFAVAAVPFAFLVARRLLTPFAARIAVVLFATNGMLIDWARVVRSYSLALLLATAATWAYLRAVDQGGARRWGVWVALATLGVYAHLFTALVLAVHVLAIPLFTTEPRRRREGVFATVTLGVLLLPLAGLALAAGDGQIWWIEDLHPRQLLWFATEFSGTSTSVLAIPAVMLFLSGAITLGRSLPGLRPEAKPQVSAAFVLAWLALPIGVVVLVSLVRPLFVPRYFIVLLPAYAMVVAVGIARLRARPWLAALALVSVMVTSLPLLVSRYDPAGHEDWRGAAAAIAAGWRPGDVIVIDPDLNLISLEHYLAQWDADRLPVPVQGLQPGDFDTGYTGRPQVVDFERSLEVPQAERVWLVVREPSEAITAVRSADGVVAPPGMQDWRLRATWVSEKTSVALLEAPDGGGA